MTRPSRSAPVLALLSAVATAAACLVALAQAPDEPSPKRTAAGQPPLGLTATLAPSPAGPDTLLRLSVAIENRGDRPVSAFRFEVTAGGRELPVYRDEVFLAPIPAGERRTLPLHNLWVSEQGRPPPADGRLRVEVTLVGASSVTRERTPQGIRWRVTGPVAGLPLRAEAEVAIR